MKTRLLVPLLLALALIAAACGGGDDDGSSDAAADDEPTTEEAATSEDSAGTAAPDDVVVATDEARCAANQEAGTITWLSSFDFAAAAGILDVITAKDQGYFDELCLDVELVPGDAPSNGAEVAGGAAQISTAGSFSELVNNNVEVGADLVAIGQYGHTAIEALVVPADGEIVELADLPGTTMGVKGDIPYSIQAMLAISDVERRSIEEVPLDGFDPITHLESGIDSLPVYKTNELAQLTAAGVPFTTFDPLDLDVPSSFGIVFTTRDFLAEHPQAVESFMEASLRGYQYAVENPDQAVAAAFELLEAAGYESSLTPETEVVRWETETALVEAATPIGLEIGMIDILALGDEILLMTDVLVFAAEPDWPSMVDPTVVEAVYA